MNSNSRKSFGNAAASRGVNNYRQEPSFLKKPNQKQHGSNRIKAPLPINLPSLRKEQSKAPQPNVFPSVNPDSFNHPSKWSNNAGLASKAAESDGFLKREDFPTLRVSGSTTNIPEKIRGLTAQPVVSKKSASDGLADIRDQKHNQHHGKALPPPLLSFSPVTSRWVDDDRDTGDYLRREQPSEDYLRREPPSKSRQNHHGFASSSVTEFDIGDTLNEIAWLPRRKKDNCRPVVFDDPERESYEAEIERVQKIQEEGRRKLVEAQEKALELGKREQGERATLAREAQERQQRILEEEARERAIRAEQEALETEKQLKEKREREKEKRRILLDEERRKEAARQKLLELERRIAEREARKKLSEEPTIKCGLDEDEETVASSCRSERKKDDTYSAAQDSNQTERKKDDTDIAAHDSDHAIVEPEFLCENQVVDFEIHKSMTDRIPSAFADPAVSSSVVLSDVDSKNSSMESTGGEDGLAVIIKNDFEYDDSEFLDKQTSMDTPKPSNEFLLHCEGHSEPMRASNVVDRLLMRGSVSSPLLSEFIPKFPASFVGISDSSSLFNAKFDNSVRNDGYLVTSMHHDRIHEGFASENEPLKKGNDQHFASPEYMCPPSQNYEGNQDVANSCCPTKEDGAFAQNVEDHCNIWSRSSEGHSVQSPALDLKHIIYVTDTDDAEPEEVSEQKDLSLDNASPSEGPEYLPGSPISPLPQNGSMEDTPNTTEHSQDNATNDSDGPTTNNNCGSAVEGCLEEDGMLMTGYENVKEIVPQIDGDISHSSSGLNDRKNEVVVQDYFEMKDIEINKNTVLDDTLRPLEDEVILGQIRSFRSISPTLFSNKLNAEGIQGFADEHHTVQCETQPSSKSTGFQPLQESQSSLTQCSRTLQAHAIVKQNQISVEDFQTPIQLKFGQFRPTLWFTRETKAIYFGTIPTLLYPSPLMPSQSNIECTPLPESSQQSTETTLQDSQYHVSSKQRDLSANTSLKESMTNGNHLASTVKFRRYRKETHNSKPSKTYLSRKQIGRHRQTFKSGSSIQRKQRKVMFVPKERRNVGSSLLFSSSWKEGSEPLHMTRKLELQCHSEAYNTHKSYPNLNRDKCFQQFNLRKTGHGKKLLISTEISSDQTADIVVDSGIVHVFEQPGIDTRNDEVGFIEVRSKAQMLNLKRGHKQKEESAYSSNNRHHGKSDHSFTDCEATKQFANASPAYKKTRGKETMVWKQKQTLENSGVSGPKEKGASTMSKGCISSMTAQNSQEATVNQRKSLQSILQQAL